MLPPDHFLLQPRQDFLIGVQEGHIDTSTLAAHDFDVDTRTGFMPPDPPLSRLPAQWELWETALDAAMQAKLQLSVKRCLTVEEKNSSESWREHVRKLPVLPMSELTHSELLLRRAHHVLTFIMHFYIYTLPLSSSVLIPEPISVPLVAISNHLQLPPVVTYSDNVLYNWDIIHPRAQTELGFEAPALDNLRSQDMFSGTIDEQEFYLASARIELRGVEALELMRATMDELFVGDKIAIRRITAYLYKLASVVGDLTTILLDVRKGCDPNTFYHSIRPWFRGADSDPAHRKWVFEGVEEQPTDLSGPSAGQSALIHALDVFLGLDNCNVVEGGVAPDQRTLLRRMQIYMPRYHRNFLRHLSTSPRPVRTFVMQTRSDMNLLDAYNSAVQSVKEFRDAHIKIVAIYIIAPAARERTELEHADPEAKEVGKQVLMGTGGTDLVRFLKGVRDKTAEAVVEPTL
ncbi:Indoleamine 2,3-dioxygenase [Suillus fuscotomentosus]|uniref:Indoleamine 2,3-dioxygenase n=1 Tax=Suillus fuscotomentosus TaxID=1912939 RepID=A0AAD4EG25_9AGAM|nr:Indoleamine 2,3-dioxygenase [Suillus fuscotomentosus]KAG1905406.1 Indoleamine 2,3-dioxygenase [Suillus fuscotomentosus]